MSDEPSNEVLVSHIDQIWKNIQHTESYRSNLFSAYLLISGAFFTFTFGNAGDAATSFPTPKTVPILGAGALAVGTIGVLLSQALYRFRIMLERDMGLVKALKRIIANRTCREDAEAFRTWLEQLERDETRYNSVSMVLLLTTCLISSASFIAAFAGTIIVAEVWYPILGFGIFLIIFLLGRFGLDIRRKSGG